MRTAILPTLVLFFAGLAAAPATVGAGDLAAGEIAAASSKNKQLCETKWPRHKRAKPAATRTCLRYWLYNYGGYSAQEAGEDLDSAISLDPHSQHAIVTKVLAEELLRMAGHVRAACGECSDGDVTSESRAIEMFEAAAASHFSLFDPNVVASIEPHLARLFAGERLEPTEELRHLSAVTLWKLRNAVYARHGRPFRNPDLQRFFYGDRGKGAEKTKLLPRTPNPDYTDELLSKADQANVALILKLEGRSKRAK